MKAVIAGDEQATDDERVDEDAQCHGQSDLKSSWSGEVTSAPNVPARMRPAEVMTVPVLADATRMPDLRSRVALSSRTRDIKKML